MTVVTIPRATVPFVGNAPMSAEWYRWASDITQRVGGPTGAGSNDLSLSQFDDAGIEEAKANINDLRQEVRQAPQAAQEAVMALESSVHAIVAQAQQMSVDMDGLALAPTLYSVPGVGDPICRLGILGGMVGMYGTAGALQAAAYIKTYATASRTIPNATFSNLATTAATNVAPYGFSTAAQADAIATKVNQLAADVLILKQLIVSLVNDNSTSLGVGLNAT